MSLPWTSYLVALVCYCNTIWALGNMYILYIYTYMGWLPFWRGHFPSDEEQRVRIVCWLHLLHLDFSAFMLMRTSWQHRCTTKPLDSKGQADRRQQTVVTHSLSQSASQSAIQINQTCLSSSGSFVRLLRQTAKSQENSQLFLYKCKQKSRMRRSCPAAFLARIAVACRFISYRFVLLPEDPENWKLKIEN